MIIGGEGSLIAIIDAFCANLSFIMFGLRSSRLALACKIKFTRLSVKFWIPLGEELTSCNRFLASGELLKGVYIVEANYLL
jgi:hypothetical protein